MCPEQAVKGPCAEPDPFWGAELLGTPKRASRCLGLPSVPLSPAPLQGRQRDQPHFFHVVSLALLELLLRGDERGAAVSPIAWAGPDMLPALEDHGRAWTCFSPE